MLKRDELDWITVRGLRHERSFLGMVLESDWQSTFVADPQPDSMAREKLSNDDSQLFTHPSLMRVFFFAG